MIAHLHGTVTRHSPGEATVDVGGVGYRVLVPPDVWEQLEEGATAKLWISTFVREDRFDLFGFLSPLSRTLFEELLGIPGIGPRTALEICSVPRSLIGMAIREKDASPLTSIKGIGKKTAEKLLVELKSLAEKLPALFMGTDAGAVYVAMDPDAVAALEALGYDAPTITHALKSLPADLASTEDRVAAALRSL
ncbi:MAG: Holliday junction branch migration protein RuvA [Candidatus Peribacteraceae bacterium]|nr:Holliday junction branch migration protein RuvA [Candidatus Peribacteraceae bacterium]MDD5742385.1 Holliday junction branch migration protein RuvA [Candidatus Peribacteraceae bacterium]